MEMRAEKHLIKKSLNAKAAGIIDFTATPDHKRASIAGVIVGEYDYISNIDEDDIKQAFELIFKEDKEK